MPIVRKHESGYCAYLRTLRETAARGNATCVRDALRATSSRPAGINRCPSNVPEVPEILSARKQVLRILRHPSTGNCASDGAAPGAGSTAGGAAQTRRDTTRAFTAPGGAASTDTRSPALATPYAAPCGFAPRAATNFDASAHAISLSAPRYATPAAHGKAASRPRV